MSFGEVCSACVFPHIFSVENKFFVFAPEDQALTGPSRHQPPDTTDGLVGTIGRFR